MNTPFAKELGLSFPLFMAPMFLVSNQEMVIAGIKKGIVGSFPSLNFREKGELEAVLDELNEQLTRHPGTYAVNLIAQRSNPMFDKHLDICAEKKVPIFITSLGSPKKVIDKAHKYGAKVYCDVTNIKYAQKVYDLGCDGFIAVGQGAGGHSGNTPLNVLVPALKKRYSDKPVIASGGIATGAGIVSALALGADAAYIGTRFIASNECPVNEAYKSAIVRAGMDDIVMSSKISGTPATVINTDYAKKIGYKQNYMEKQLTKNRTVRKYFKMWVQYSGMKKLEDSIKPGNYKTLWVAGKSSELVDEIKPVGRIIDDLILESKESLDKLTALNATTPQNP
jgi:nitronate monooxygenase